MTALMHRTDTLANATLVQVIIPSIESSPRVRPVVSDKVLMWIIARCYSTALFENTDEDTATHLLSRLSYVYLHDKLCPI